MRRLLQQRDRLHDLASLAIAALGHVDRAPSLLNRVISFGIKTLNGGYRLAIRVAHRRDARSGGVAVDMDRTGPTCSNAAAEFRASKSKNVAQIPEHGHRRIAVE